jgi:hypothetical protein
MKRTEPNSGNRRQGQRPFSRRGFFKASSTFGAAVSAQAVLGSAIAAPQQPGYDRAFMAHASELSLG